MTLLSALLLFIAAAVAGAINSVAGGGSFVSFPALLFTGVAPVAANATNSIALWPAGLASAFAYRSDMRQPRAHLLALGGASLTGGIVGALLLLRTRDTTFVRLIPYLLLVATLVFTFGPSLTARLRNRARPGQVDSREIVMPLAWGTLMQLVISLYGGYFGAGMGIMMLATLSLMGMTNIHAMNGLKTLLGTLINGAAVLAFVVAGAVAWAPGAVMIAGGILGGYAGAAVARRLDPTWGRRGVLAIAWGMTAYFFVRAYTG